MAYGMVASVASLAGYNMAPVNKPGEIMYRASLVTWSENMPPDNCVIARRDCIQLKIVKKCQIGVIIS